MSNTRNSQVPTTTVPVGNYQPGSFLPATQYQPTTGFQPSTGFLPSTGYLPTTGFQPATTGFQPSYLPASYQPSSLPTTIQPSQYLPQPTYLQAPTQSWVPSTSQVQSVPYQPQVIQQSVQQQNVSSTGQPIKGESRIEYIPYTKEVTEYVTQEVVEYVPREKKITDYYAVEYVTEHIPQVIQEKYIEYVPVETIKERTEYQAVTRQQYIQTPELQQQQFVQNTSAVYQAPIQQTQVSYSPQTYHVPQTINQGWTTQQTTGWQPVGNQQTTGWQTVSQQSTGWQPVGAPVSSGWQPQVVGQVGQAQWQPVYPSATGQVPTQRFAGTSASALVNAPVSQTRGSQIQ